MLQRDYFFEFAGMPQSGKTTVMDSVAHFLKREGFLIEEYRGGSRYSPLYNSPIADLNLWLACKAVEFVVGAVGREKAHNKIFLLDRGLIDRCIFTDTLLRRREIDAIEAQNIRAFLSLPRLLKNLDGVFVFVTTPEIALQREYENKLTQSEGEVMSASFLSTMRLAAIDGYNEARGLVRNVHRIDTEQRDGYLLETARFVADEILRVIKEK